MYLININLHFSLKQHTTSKANYVSFLEEKYTLNYENSGADREGEETCSFHPPLSSHYLFTTYYNISFYLYLLSLSFPFLLSKYN